MLDEGNGVASTNQLVRNLASLGIACKIPTITETVFLLNEHVTT